MAKKIRVGVIGTGNIARRLHLPNWAARTDVDLVAIADPSQAALDNVIAAVGLDRISTYTDPNDLIHRSDIDVVDVCTPPRFRSDLIVSASRAGKHIFAEKPLATTPEAAAAAVAAAAEAGVVFGVNHNYLVLDEIRAVRDIIDSGEIGEVRTASVNYLGVVDVPGQTGDWRHDPAQSGGGVLMDIIHAVYVAESFLAEPIERVSAFVTAKSPSAHVEDMALCRFETASKAALVNIGWGLGHGHIEVTGTLGRASIRYRDGGTAPWAPLESVTVTTASGTRTALGPEKPRPSSYDEFPPIAKTFPLLLDQFVSAVQTGAAPYASGADALRALEATVGAYLSGATGQTVEIPLDRTSPVFKQGTVGIAALDPQTTERYIGTQLFAPIDNN